MLYCILALGSIFPSSIVAQSLMGTTGLVTIPTARMQKDGTLSMGVSYFDRKHMEYFEGTENIGMAYINLTLLPFLELVMRVNRPVPYHSVYTVDRTPMLRLRILKERTYLPAVVVGIHDFASSQTWGWVYFNATYIVLSKKINEFDFHFGYAPKIMEAHYYQLNGPFGGVAYIPNKAVSLFAEYNTKTINAGVQLQFFKHFGLSLATINFDSFATGVNFKIFL